MENIGLLFAVLVALATALLAGQALALGGFPIPEPTRRIGNVDGLRGYLALLVMMHHFDLWTRKTRLEADWGNSSSLLFHNFGPGGVALFFMATGLVFYPRISRGFRKVDWRVTLLSRVFRILPLQLVMIVVAAAISLGMTSADTGSTLARDVVALAMWATSYAQPPLFGYQDAGTINAHVLWSLWYEWMFYLFVLPLAALVRDITRAWLPGWMIPLAMLVIGVTIGPFVKHPGVVFFLPLFAAGMIAYELRAQATAQRLLAGPILGAISVTLLAVAMIGAKGPYALPQFLAYALFFCCVAAGNSFWGVLGARGSIVLGEISFGLYLIHGTVLYLLFTFGVTSDLPLGWLYATLPLATLVAVMVSAAAHLIVERPGITLGRRLSGLAIRKFPARADHGLEKIVPGC